jgi:hypothetical protein
LRAAICLRKGSVPGAIPALSNRFSEGYGLPRRSEHQAVRKCAEPTRLYSLQ